jgi:hypothetical protein
LYATAPFIVRGLYEPEVPVVEETVTVYDPVQLTDPLVVVVFEAPPNTEYVPKSMVAGSATQEH